MTGALFAKFERVESRKIRKDADATARPSIKPREDSVEKTLSLSLKMQELKWSGRRVRRME